METLVDDDFGVVHPHQLHTQSPHLWGRKPNKDAAGSHALVRLATSHQVFDDLLDLGLSLLHLLRGTLQTDPLLAVREFDVNLRKHAQVTAAVSLGRPRPPFGERCPVLTRGSCCVMRPMFCPFLPMMKRCSQAGAVTSTTITLFACTEGA